MSPDSGTGSTAGPGVPEQGRGPAGGGGGRPRSRRRLSAATRSSASRATADAVDPEGRRAPGAAAARRRPAARHREPGVEQGAAPVRPVQRREGRVRGEQHRDLGPPGGERAGVGAVGVHVPVPGEQPVAQRRGRRATGRRRDAPSRAARRRCRAGCRRGSPPCRRAPTRGARTSSARIRRARYGATYARPRSRSAAAGCSLASTATSSTGAGSASRCHGAGRAASDQASCGSRRSCGRPRHDEARVEAQHRPVGVGGEHAVDRVDPAPQGVGDVAAPTGPGAAAAGRRTRRRTATRAGNRTLSPSSDQRPAVGLDHLDVDVGAAAHPDRLGVPGHGRPPVGPERGAARRRRAAPGRPRRGARSRW